VFRVLAAWLGDLLDHKRREVGGLSESGYFVPGHATPSFLNWILSA
jgi:hypothetical protein